MCHRICPHILAKTQYWKVLVSCAPPSIRRPSESKSHCSRFCRNLSGAWATLSSEFNMSASSSNMSTSLRTSETFLVWVVGSWLREFLHCANSYPGIETRRHCIGSHLYILYTVQQFRSRYWDIEVSQTQIGSCYVLSSLSLQYHADILDL